MKNVNLLLHKYVWKVDLSNKLLSYLPKSNGIRERKKQNFEGNECFVFLEEGNKKVCSKTQSISYEKLKERKYNLKC